VKKKHAAERETPTGKRKTDLDFGSWDKKKGGGKPGRRGEKSRFNLTREVRGARAVGD